MTYLQSLAADVNMPDVNITLDVDAAINAYKLLWNYPRKFGNVIVHLGDFHFLKENFKGSTYLYIYIMWHRFCLKIKLFA